MAEQQFASVDEYIASFPPETAAVLERLRALVREAAPDAAESISYHMPTYSLGGTHLVFFAGWKTHVALYAVPRFDGPLDVEVAPYRAAKDTLKFSLRTPLPEAVVAHVLTELAALRRATQG